MNSLTSWYMFKDHHLSYCNPDFGFNDYYCLKAKVDYPNLFSFGPIKKKNCQLDICHFYHHQRLQSLSLCSRVSQLGLCPTSGVPHALQLFQLWWICPPFLETEPSSEPAVKLRCGSYSWSPSCGVRLTRGWIPFNRVLSFLPHWVQEFLPTVYSLHSSWMLSLLFLCIGICHPSSCKSFNHQECIHYVSIKWPF